MTEENEPYINYDAIWDICGGARHGPNVEHVSMEYAKFPRFCKALIDSARRSPSPSAEGMRSEDCQTREALEAAMAALKSARESLMYSAPENASLHHMRLFNAATDVIAAFATLSAKEQSYG